MLLSDLQAALRRRWYFALVGVLLTGNLAIAATLLFPVTYESRALVVLLPPRTLLDINNNPYLALGGLDSAAAVLARAMTSEETAASVSKVSADATYGVDPDPSTSGPVLLVLVEDTNQAGSTVALATLLDILPVRLRSLQKQIGAPDSSLITLSVITQTAKPSPVRKSQLRALIVAVGAGLALTVLGTSFIDGLLLSRYTRRQHSPGRSRAYLDDRPDPPPPNEPEWAAREPAAPPSGLKP